MSNAPVHFRRFSFFAGRLPRGRSEGLTFTSFRISESNFSNPLGFLLILNLSKTGTTPPVILIV